MTHGRALTGALPATLEISLTPTARLPLLLVLAILGVGGCRAVVVSELGLRVDAPSRQDAEALAELADACWVEAARLLDAPNDGARPTIGLFPTSAGPLSETTRGAHRAGRVLVGTWQASTLRHEFCHALVETGFAPLSPLIEEGLAHWVGEGGCPDPTFGPTACTLLGLDIIVPTSALLRALPESDLATPFIGAQGTWAPDLAAPRTSLALLAAGAHDTKVCDEARALATLLVDALVAQVGMQGLRDAAHQLQQTDSRAFDVLDAFAVLDIPATRQGMATVVARALPVGDVRVRKEHRRHHRAAPTASQR